MRYWMSVDPSQLEARHFTEDINMASQWAANMNKVNLTGLVKSL